MPPIASKGKASYQSCAVNKPEGGHLNRNSSHLVHTIILTLHIHKHPRVRQSHMATHRHNFDIFFLSPPTLCGTTYPSLLAFILGFTTDGWDPNIVPLFNLPCYRHSCLIYCISCDSLQADLQKWRTSEIALLPRLNQQQWWPRVLSLIQASPCLRPSHPVNSSKQTEMPAEYHLQLYPPE